MRTASTTLIAEQKKPGNKPRWKVVLSRASQSTLGYDMNRVIKMALIETPSGDQCELVLDNHDNALSSLDLEHYQSALSWGYDTGVARNAWVSGSAYAIDDIVVPATSNGYQYRCAVAGTTGAAAPTFPTSLGVTVADSAVTWEMDGKVGEEYSRCAPLRVRSWELHSGRGILKCIIRPAGILNQLGEDAATAAYTTTSSDTSTVQDRLTAVAAATLAPYSGYPAITIAYDSTDTVISTFQPADYFSVRMNETRLDKATELMSYTGSKMRPQNDGQLHVLDPVISGTAYNYEYKFNVAGEHPFFSRTTRQRFVNPNKELVVSPTSHSPSYIGAATSGVSYALAPKTHVTERRLPSSAVADSIAAAKIEQYELDADKGIITVPMNVTQELWDYVKVTDSRQGDTRIGNIQYISRVVERHYDNTPLTWQMTIAFGKPSTLSLLAGMATGRAGGLEGEGNISQASIIAMIDALYENQEVLFDAVNKLNERDTVPKWHVTQQLIIPVI